MLKYLPLIAVVGLMIYCFIDVLTADRRRFQSLGKPLWLLIALLPVIGAVLWLAVGRPRHKGGTGGDSVIHLRRPPRPIAPDDDPEFLKELDRKTWQARRESRDASKSASGDGAEETGDEGDPGPEADTGPEEAASDGPDGSPDPQR